jgi:prepilin-type N-terminal cleavage/methylation domain-containing protein
MSKISSRRGYTLLELIVALSLSSFVMMGIISVATSMVRFQFQAGLSGNAGGGTLLAVGRMTRHMEDTSYMLQPVTGVAGADYVSGCTNWSAQGNTRMSTTLSGGASWPCTNAASNVTNFVYCRNAVNEMWLHYSCSATCGSIPAVTDANCGGAVATRELIVGQRPGIFRAVGYTRLFFRTADNTGLDMHFIVGQSTPTANYPRPAFYRVDTRVMMNKSYGTTD